MTIKEAEARIVELEEAKANFMKFQNYALCLDLPDRNTTDHEIAQKRYDELRALKEELKLSVDIRTLNTIGAKLCKAEIERIQNIIDTAKVNI